MLYQQPYHFAPTENGTVIAGGAPQNCIRLSSKNTKKAKSEQKGGSGSAYQGQFHAVHINPRLLSAITSQYIDDSPMFNPLRRNTVIPTIFNGIVPTGAYLLHNLPTTPDYSKYNSGPVSETDVHCLCQSRGIPIYDEVDGKLVPRNKQTLLRKLGAI